MKGLADSIYKVAAVLEKAGSDELFLGSRFRRGIGGILSDDLITVETDRLAAIERQVALPNMDEIKRDTERYVDERVAAQIERQVALPHMDEIKRDTERYVDEQVAAQIEQVAANVQQFNQHTERYVEEQVAAKLEQFKRDTERYVDEQVAANVQQFRERHVNEQVVPNGKPDQSSSSILSSSESVSFSEEPSFVVPDEEEVEVYSKKRRNRSKEESLEEIPPQRFKTTYGMPPPQEINPEEEKSESVGEAEPTAYQDEGCITFLNAVQSRRWVSASTNGWYRTTWGNGIAGVCSNIQNQDLDHTMEQQCFIGKKPIFTNVPEQKGTCAFCQRTRTLSIHMSLNGMSYNLGCKCAALAQARVNFYVGLQEIANGDRTDAFQRLSRLYDNIHTANKMKGEH